MVDGGGGGWCYCPAMGQQPDRGAGPDVNSKFRARRATEL